MSSEQQETMNRVIEFLKDCEEDIGLSTITSSIDHHYASDQSAHEALMKKMRRRDDVQEIKDGRLIYWRYVGKGDPEDKVGHIGEIHLKRAGSRYVATYEGQIDLSGMGDTAVGAVLRLALSMMNDKKFRGGSTEAMKAVESNLRLQQE